MKGCLKVNITENSSPSYAEFYCTKKNEGSKVLNSGLEKGEQEGKNTSNCHVLEKLQGKVH